MSKAECDPREGMEFDIGGTVVDLSMDHIHSLTMMNLQGLMGDPNTNKAIEKEISNARKKGEPEPPTEFEHLDVGPRQLLIGFNQFAGKNIDNTIKTFRNQLKNLHGIETHNTHDLIELPVDDKNFHAAADVLLRMQVKSTRNPNAQTKLHLRRHPEVKIMADVAEALLPADKPTAVPLIHQLKMLEAQIESAITFAAETILHDRPFPNEAIKDQYHNLVQKLPLSATKKDEVVDDLIQKTRVATETVLADGRTR